MTSPKVGTRVFYGLKIEVDQSNSSRSNSSSSITTNVKSNPNPTIQVKPSSYMSAEGNVLRFILMRGYNQNLGLDTDTSGSNIIMEKQ